MKIGMPKKHHYYQILLLFVVLVALAVRLTPMLSERDFWYDEAFTGILLKADFFEMNQLIFLDVHPPLYYWLVDAWSGIFGLTPVAIRSFSLFFGIATIISVFWIGKRMFNPRAGLLTATFLAFSPFAILYSVEARMYSLFGFLILWAVWFFYQGLKTRKIESWLYFGIFAGLAFYTHYLTIFFWVIFYLTFFFYQLIFKKKSVNPLVLFNRSGRKKVKLSKRWEKFAPIGDFGFWIGIGTMFLFFLSWLKIFLLHKAKGGLGWIPPAHLSDIPETLQIFFFGHPPGTGGTPWSNEFKYFFDGTSAGLLIFSIFLITFFYAWNKKKKREELFVLTTISLGTLLFLIILPHLNIAMLDVRLYVARYFMPAAVIFFLLFSGIITSIFPNKKSTWLVTLVIYAGLLMMLRPINYQHDWNDLWQNQAKILDENSLIVATNPFAYTTARYYFGENRVRYFNRDNPTEDFSGWVVVGNHNRIDSVQKLKANSNYYLLTENCDWQELPLIEVMRLENHSVCKVK